jgi:hypothetical protein
MSRRTTPGSIGSETLSHSDNCSWDLAGNILIPRDMAAAVSAKSCLLLIEEARGRMQREFLKVEIMVVGEWEWEWERE